MAAIKDLQTSPKKMRWHKAPIAGNANTAYNHPFAAFFTNSIWQRPKCVIQKGCKKCASLCDDVYGCYYQLPTPSAGVPFVSAKGTKTSRRRAQIMHFYSACHRRFLRRTHSQNILLNVCSIRCAKRELMRRPD